MELPPPPVPRLRLVTAQGFEAAAVTVEDRIFHVPATEAHLVDLNVGAPLPLWARHGGCGERHVQRTGDIDIVPAGVATSWESDAVRRADVLFLSMPPAFVRGVAARAGLDPDRVALVDRVGARDPQIELIGRALLSEMEAGEPSGPLYVEALATALTVRVLSAHNQVPLRVPAAGGGGLSATELRRALDHIHDRLDGALPLAELAAVAHRSPSHFTRLFRRAMGLAPHQYVLARRVEEAERLLRAGALSVGEVAARVGFASQSHLHRHFKRRYGVAPTALRTRARTR